MDDSVEDQIQDLLRIEAWYYAQITAAENPRQGIFERFLKVSWHSPVRVIAILQRIEF